MRWTELHIDGVFMASLNPHYDDRGCLVELYRADELPSENGLEVDYDCRPEMAYLSWTKRGVVRGPHEHRWQSDLFVFSGLVTSS